MLRIKIDNVVIVVLIILTGIMGYFNYTLKLQIKENKAYIEKTVQLLNRDTDLIKENKHNIGELADHISFIYSTMGAK